MAAGDLAYAPRPQSFSDSSEPQHPAISTGDLVRAAPCNAEAFAAQCLQNSHVLSEDIIQLISLLPSEHAPRSKHRPVGENQNPPNDQFAWGTGAFVHGGVVGVRRNAHEYPKTTQLLAAYAKAHAPDSDFTSLLLLSQVQSPLHADRNNASGYPNFLIGVSNFEQGELWVESADGSVPCPDQPDASEFLLGELHPVSGTTIWFDAHCRHCTAPWVGSRIVLAGFVIKGFQAFTQQDHDFLVGLDFALPGVGTGDLLCGTTVCIERGA